MNTLVYAPDTGRICEKFQSQIEGLVPVENIETYKTTTELSKRLRQPKYDLAACILCTPNRKALLEILSLRELLENLRIILLLPDRKKDTISEGHRLRPRFLSYMDEEPALIAEVLRKMLSNDHQDWQGINSEAPE